MWGLPFAVAAVVVGIAALRGRAAARWAAYVGLLLGAAMTLMILLWTVLDAPLIPRDVIRHRPPPARTPAGAAAPRTLSG